MKIKRLIFFASISVILSALAAIAYMSVLDKKETVRLFDQNQPNIAENYVAASMSKGTIILLLAVGAIGVLGVSRKKNDTDYSAPKKEITKSFPPPESE
jgi:hypothetical protein